MPNIKDFLFQNQISFQFEAMPKFWPQKGMFGYFCEFSRKGSGTEGRNLRQPTSVTLCFYKGKGHVGYRMYDFKEKSFSGEYRILTPQELKLWERGCLESFKQYRAKPIPPNAVEVLHSVISDIRCYLDAPDPDDFIENLGFGENYKQGLETFEACRKTKKDFQNLLGWKLFQEMMKCDEE
jgi:hypothetical protein